MKAVILAGGFGTRLGEETYLKQLLQFNKNTPSLMRQEIQKLVNEDIENLILDLRGNPGGELYSCLEIVDMFLKEGVIVKIKFRDEENVFSAKAGDIAEDLNLVVIVDDVEILFLYKRERMPFNIHFMR